MTRFETIAHLNQTKSFIKVLVKAEPLKTRERSGNQFSFDHEMTLLSKLKNCSVMNSK